VYNLAARPAESPSPPGSAQKARLWSWAAMHRRGTLLGGEQGDRLVAEADEAMKAEGIHKPSSMARMLAPVPVR
jgi:hypothetical protein